MYLYCTECRAWFPADRFEPFDHGWGPEMDHVLPEICGGQGEHLTDRPYWIPVQHFDFQQHRYVEREEWAYEGECCPLAWSQESAIPL